MGQLMNGHDLKIFATALLRLLRCPIAAGTIGNAARARAGSEVNLEATKQRYYRLYRELAGVAHD